MTKTICRIILAILMYMCPASVAGQPASAAQAGRIHCVTDISHDFTFYFASSAERFSWRLMRL